LILEFLPFQPYNLLEAHFDGASNTKTVPGFSKGIWELSAIAGEHDESDTEKKCPTPGTKFVVPSGGARNEELR
jgi:hypothetical protein